METGLTHSTLTVVAESNTAAYIGSGDLAVFATPAMVALMENAAMLAVAPSLDESQTTVGSQINTTHIKPTAVGGKVVATATLAAVEGRKLTFKVEARDEQGIIGEGTHVRYIVDRAKFLAKLK